MKLLFCNECSGIGQSFGSDVGTTEHTGNFVKTLIGRELLDVGDGLGIGVGLEDAEVLISLAGDLWQVGDGDDLQVSG